ncbi:MAG: glycoside hydrolase TIM-barrel-like domain-containing protein [Rickettsiaceae bacterium H1]|nr:glycoside hydrolase TIM-barrel-like domain-containing protein [Rickettsiaceae bacterium H1]
MTCAIAICSGLAKELINIYANEKIIDKNSIKYRFYPGTEEQKPDQLINEIEKGAPAYRGIAYIVIEDFSLGDYNNKIPNFTFEISCNINCQICRKITAVNIIPGSGKFVYDTKVQSKSFGKYVKSKWVQQRKAKTINQNSNQNLSDAIVGLNNMKNTLPNLSWVSVVINWFGDDLDIAKCNIYPAVEYKNNAKSIPDDWQVAGITKKNARIISQIADKKPLYGGTVSDDAIIRYLEELQKRKYKILVYPMLLMDMKGKIWRGNISGNHTEVKFFFAKYEKFILHYANLTKEFADGFVIGSELKGITRINHNNNYPGIRALMELAKSVKNILGKKTIITYAANWDEYHSYNEEYYMDGLWSSRYIDVVGINAYFPLTDKPQPPCDFSPKEIKQGWSFGEGYDYYYQDNERHKDKTKFTSAKRAWKNIEKWWSEKHVNSNGQKTGWKPKMKKIWFIEYGFPGVDGCSNQPNVFIGDTAKENKFPFFSKGNIDFKEQATAIEGSIDKWQNSEMIEKMFLWAWDARPFPYFPNLLNVWSDNNSWKFSHEIQRKLGLPQLDEIIADILHRANYQPNEFECIELNQQVDGLILNEIYNARSAIEVLRKAYLFDIISQGKMIIFQLKTGKIKLKINRNDLVPINNSSFSINRSTDTTNKIKLIYIDKMNNYELSSTYSELHTESKNIKIIFLPLVLSNYHARSICNEMLAYAYQTKIRYTLNLPPHSVKLFPGDIIKVILREKEHTIKITHINYGKILHITGILYDS